MERKELKGMSYATEANALRKLAALKIECRSAYGFVVCQDGRYYPLVALSLGDPATNGLMGYIAHNGVTVVA